MTSHVDAAFWSVAEQAGLLRTIDGRRYVADEYVDGASGQKQCLIEYADPELLADAAPLAALLAHLRQRHPVAASVLLRAPGDVRLGPPWRRYLSYVRHDPAPRAAADGPNDAGTGVVVAGPEHHAPLREWLVRALRTGSVEQHRPVVDESLLATAETLLDRADRVSYVYLRGGVAVGHVTVLDDGHDDVTGRAFVDLFDVLVEAVDGRAEAHDRLVAAAVAHATDRALPLLGHVVHPTDEESTGRAVGVLRALLASGWVTDHTYWVRPLPEDLSS